MEKLNKQVPQSGYSDDAGWDAKFAYQNEYLKNLPEEQIDRGMLQRMHAAARKPSMLLLFLEAEENERVGNGYHFFGGVFDLIGNKDEEKRSLALRCLQQFNPLMHEAFVIQHPAALLSTVERYSVEFLDRVLFNEGTLRNSNFSGIFRHLKVTTPDIRKLAVMADYRCLNDIENPDAELYESAVQGNPEALELVPRHFQTSEMVFHAVAAMPKVVRYVKSPHFLLEEALEVALNQSMHAFPSPGRLPITTGVLKMFKSYCVKKGFYPTEWFGQPGFGDFTQEEYIEMLENTDRGREYGVERIFEKLLPEHQLRLALEWEWKIRLPISVPAFSLVVNAETQTDASQMFRKLIKLLDVCRDGQLSDLLDSLAETGNELLLVALMQYDGSLLKFLDGGLQTAAVCYAAVMQSPNAIRWAFCLTDDVVKASYRKTE